MRVLSGKFEILKRYTRNGITVAYLIKHTESHVEQVLASKAIILLARQNSIKDVCYDPKTDSIFSDIIDLKRIPSEDFDSYLEYIKLPRENHKKAQIYMQKQKLLGKELLKFRLLDDDKVQLEEVLDKDSTGKLIIPSFVTGIYTKFYTGGIDTALDGCKFTEIYIDNQLNTPFSADYLCYRMGSTHIKLSFANPECVYSFQGLFKECYKLKSVDINGLSKAKPQSLAEMFLGCEKLEAVDLSMLDATNIASMRGIFSFCTNLKDIHFGNFYTAKLVTMSYAFSKCESLERLDLSSFCTKKVTNMTGLFYECKKLKSVNLSSFDTSNVIKMRNMFKGCRSLESLDLRNFNTSKVEVFSYMFFMCSNLKSLDLSSFDLSQSSEFHYMFSDCKNLQNLKFDFTKLLEPDINTQNIVRNCDNLEEAQYIFELLQSKKQ